MRMMMSPALTILIRVCEMNNALGNVRKWEDSDKRLIKHQSKSHILG